MTTLLRTFGGFFAAMMFWLILWGCWKAGERDARPFHLFHPFPLPTAGTGK